MSGPKYCSKENEIADDDTATDTVPEVVFTLPSVTLDENPRQSVENLLRENPPKLDSENLPNSTDENAEAEDDPRESRVLGLVEKRNTSYPVVVIHHNPDYRVSKY